MLFSVFIQSLIATFLVIASVGPVFLTTANIAMTQGYKSGLYAIFGCIIGDIIFITIACFATNVVVSFMPQYIVIILMLCAGTLLIKIAYAFWRKDIKNINALKINKENIYLSIKMLFLTLSSPLSIIGYSVVFTAIVAKSDAILQPMSGGYCGVFLAHFAIVAIFGIIGKKINSKALFILNKLSACLIAFYAILIFIKAIKMMFL